MLGKFGWLNVLLAPVTGLHAEGGDGGAAPAAGGAGSGEPPNPAAAPADQPQGGPITMGARVYTPEEVAAAVAQPKEPKPGAGGADGAGDKKAEPPANMVPRERLSQVTQQLRETRILAGLDPDTGKPAPKAADPNAAAKPQEFAKGQEPWAKDLLPLPRQDDKDDKGNEKYADTASFLEALAEAKAHNKIVEHMGRQKLKDDAAAQERAQQQQTQADNAAIHAFTTEKLPAALKERGLIADGALPHQVQEAFNTALAPLQALPPMERQSTFLYNFAVKNAKSGAGLLLAVAEEAKTAEGVAAIMKLGSLNDNELISELIAMDRLVQLGFTIQGKPRAKPQTKGLTSGGEQRSGENISPTPSTNGVGSAVDLSKLTGDAYFKQLEAEQAAHNEKILKRLGGSRN